MIEKRIEWLDAVRGFGIILVILGHMVLPEILTRFIYSFHMPLFFVLSGYLYQGDFSTAHLFRKADSLLIPYVLYGWLSIGAIALTGMGNAEIAMSEWRKGNGVGVTWFLICLFEADFLGALVIRVLRGNRWLLWVAVILLAVSGWCVSRSALPNCFMSNVVLAAGAFWLLGYLLKSVRLCGWWWLVFAVPAAFFPMQRVDIGSGMLGNGFLFYVVAGAMAVLILGFFERIPFHIPFLPFIGKRSLPFMCLHGVIPCVLSWCVLRSGIENSGYVRWMLRFLSLALLVLSAWVIGKYIPILSGRARGLRRVFK